MGDFGWPAKPVVLGRQPLGRPATYADLEALPETVVGEIIDGQLHVSPRPRPRHARAVMALSGQVFEAFDRAVKRPGGWWILVEPGIELPGAPEIVPDIAGWRRERLPTIEPGKPIRLAPDWVCEVASPSTRTWDFVTKRPFYARVGVAWHWTVDPEFRWLSVSRLAEGKWVEECVHGGTGRVRLPPFEAIEVDLGSVWPFEDEPLVAHDSEGR